jgi:hypothetical protein
MKVARSAVSGIRGCLTRTIIGLNPAKPIFFPLPGFDTGFALLRLSRAQCVEAADKAGEYHISGPENRSITWTSAAFLLQKFANTLILVPVTVQGEVH